MHETQKVAFEFVCHDMPGRLFEPWSDVCLKIQHGTMVIGGAFVTAMKGYLRVHPSQVRRCLHRLSLRR